MRPLRRAVVIPPWVAYPLMLLGLIFLAGGPLRAIDWYGYWLGVVLAISYGVIIIVLARRRSRRQSSRSPA